MADLVDEIKPVGFPNSELALDVLLPAVQPWVMQQKLRLWRASAIQAPSHGPRGHLCLAAAALLLFGGCPSPETLGTLDDLTSDVGTDAAGDGDSSGDTPKDSPDTAVDVPPPEFCQGTTSYLYDPVTGDDFTTFPDDFFTDDAPETLTGLRVRIDSTNAPWLETSIPTTVVDVFAQLGTLDGFGTTAGVTLRFSAPIGDDLPSGGAASVNSDALMLLDLGPANADVADEAVRVPFEVQYTDEGSTAILWPMVPLKPKHRHIAVLTNAHLASDGGCVAPSETLQKLLAATAQDTALVRLVPRYAEALAQAGLAPDDVSAAVVFTTQSIVEHSVAVAESIAAQPLPSWSTQPTCTDTAEFRVCEGTFTAWDYRDADGVLRGTTPVASYEMPVRLYLPLTATSAGAPVMLYGHGLGGTRDQAERLAELAVPMGFAAVSIDAPHHGDHPGPEAPGAGLGEPLDTLIGFFGFITDPELGVNGLVLRDNWRQATFDKLQLVRLLRADPDFDDDGQPELDTGSLVYAGASLGAIMGNELLALSDAFGAAILMVGGARVASIIQEAEQFQIIITIMNPGGSADDGEVQRFFPVLQTLIEAGDPANYGPHVLRNRLAPGGNQAPHLLLTHAHNDNTVPPGTNRALARSIGEVAHVPPHIYDVGIIQTAGSAPVSGNVVGDEGQTITSALFQFDRITKGPGANVQLAKHGNVPDSFESFTQIDHFLTTWAQTGVPEVIDPYAVLGTGPLP